MSRSVNIEKKLYRIKQGSELCEIAILSSDEM